jgi:preprotein translocase subunit SecD
MNVRALLAAAAIAALVGCQSPPTKVVTLHEVLRQPPSGIVPQVNPNPIFGSQHIRRAEAVIAPAGTGLEMLCETDRVGAEAWFQASRAFCNRPVAVLLDGRFLHVVVLQAAARDDIRTFTIPGPFIWEDAKHIAKESEDNYRKLNEGK